MKKGKVSRDLQKALDHAVGKKLSASQRTAFKRIQRETAADEKYIRCTWWAGCYYCQDLWCKWHVIECYA